ncbi:MAG: 16S rRNA (uracil(1498)-N(3))-methyltransferase, partial [Eubacteriales bacterium]
AQHIAHALRMRRGEKLVLCDCLGMDYDGEIERIEPGGTSVLVRILGCCQSVSEPSLRVTLYQALPKQDKFDTVVQKAVELGAWEIQPVESSRCVVKLDGRTAEKKVARLQKIALEAAKQSGRGIVPQVLQPVPLRRALEHAAREGELLFFYEEGTESLRETLKNTGDRLFLFVGPEGGFSREEAELAASFGAKLLTLGPRILRTETAPVAALAAIFYEKGDMEISR